MAASFRTDAVSRRDLLRGGIAVAAAAACQGCALFALKTRPDLTLEGERGTASFDPRDFPALEEAGGAVVVKVRSVDDKIIVFRRPDRTLRAVSTTCTHKGCDVEYQADRDRLVCPCHGAEFGVDGCNLAPPAKVPLKAYAVQERTDCVTIRLA